MEDKPPNSLPGWSSHSLCQGLPMTLCDCDHAGLVTMLDCFQVHLGTAATAMQTLNIRFSANLIVWPALLIIIAIITTDYNSNSLNKARISLMMIMRRLRILNWNNNIISGFIPNRMEIKYGPQSQGNWGVVYIMVSKPLFLPYVGNPVESRFKIAIWWQWTFLNLLEAVFRRFKILKC